MRLECEDMARVAIMSKDMLNIEMIIFEQFQLEDIMFYRQPDYQRLSDYWNMFVDDLPQVDISLNYNSKSKYRKKNIAAYNNDSFNQKKTRNAFFISINIYLKFIQHRKVKMLPTMRYQCSKLTELVHEKKTYHLHISSVDKIMNKTSNEFLRRSHQLHQLKNRKLQSFNYTQYKRSREIGHVNSLLYSKIYFSSRVNNKHLPVNRADSLEILQQKIEQRSKQQLQKTQKSSVDNHFVLRNHRQSPVHKSTLLERTRQNIRLAKKIVNPVITYKTSQFQKFHQKVINVKERIMKYDQQISKTKGDIYVQKKVFANDFGRKKSASSILGQQEMIKSWCQKDNPELTPISVQNNKIAAYLQKKSKD